MCVDLWPFLSFVFIVSVIPSKFDFVLLIRIYGSRRVRSTSWSPPLRFFEGSARLSLNGLLRLVGEILIFVIRPYPRKEEPKALF